MSRRRVHGSSGLLAAAIVLGLLVPAGATAAPAKPTVTTGPAANVGQTTATLTGGVTPNERETTYYFQYGPTGSYGTQTPAGSAGAGDRRVNVAADIGGLAPATTYHYRLVARNSRGETRGPDRTFRTQRQPLGLSLTATPNPVGPNGRTLLAGFLSGTGNAERQVVLQANPFPYTQGFQNVSDVHLTRADGGFSFPVLSVPVNTQYRVILPNQPQVGAPIVTVGVRPKVSVRVKRLRRTARARFVRFSGRITPEHDGALVAIQRLRGSEWRTISGTVARHSGSSSRYSKRVRLRRGGTFRIFAGTNDGDHVESVSRSVRVRIG